MKSSRVPTSNETSDELTRLRHIEAEAIRRAHSSIYPYATRARHEGIGLGIAVALSSLGYDDRGPQLVVDPS